MSAYFNPPPGWPAPPSPQWQPQAQWQPDPSWPAAPQGWPFWVDESGEPTERPAGSYPPQQTGRRNKVLGCGCLTVVALVLFGACGAVLSMGEEQAPVEVTVTPTTTVTPTAVVTPTTTAPAPTQTNPAQTTTITPTVTVAPPPPPEPTPTPEPEPAPEPEPEPEPEPVPEPEPAPAPEPEPTGDDPGSVYYQNCDAVRAAGAAPIFRGDPGYSSKLDRDDDGVGCEP